jgi:hypothetical protein
MADMTLSFPQDMVALVRLLGDVLWPKLVPAVGLVDELAMDEKRTSSDTMWKF